MAVTKRIDTARGHWYRLDGEKVDGVTTILSNGIPKPALTNWAAREVATYAADNLDTLTNLDREARIDLLKGSPWRERDRLARRGTEVHRLAELLINGKEIDVPEELAGHVNSYLDFLEHWNVDPVLVEAVVGHRTHKWMGTIDLVADMAGERWLADVKTTRSGVFPEAVLQICAYAHAEFYLDSNGDEQPMPTVDAGAVIWVRADGYDVVPVTIDDTVYRTFRYAQQVALWQTVTSKTVIGDVLTPPKKGAA